MSSLLTRVSKSVVLPMFSGLLVLTLANGRNVGYTNKKTGDKAIYKARFSKPFNPWVEGSSPSALTLDFSTKTPGSSKDLGFFRRQC